jgi:NAD(P)-dependent dehydrogenase (short-subunit alcohol dehydrogenase family)
MLITDSFRETTIDGPPVVLITGASGLIGAAVARAFSGADAVLALHYFARETAAQDLRSGLQERGLRAVCLKANLAEPSGPENLAHQTREQLGEIDVLIHSAAPKIRPCAPLGDNEEEIAAQLQINVFAFTGLCRAVLPSMLRRQQGVIVPLLSTVIDASRPKRWSAYTTAKYALTGAALGLAKDVSNSGVRVVGVMPARVDEPDSPASGAAGLVSPERVGHIVRRVCDEPDTFQNGKIVRLEGASVKVGGLVFSGALLAEV